MPCEIHVDLEGDGAWPDLGPKIAAGQIVHLGDGSSIDISVLPGGMSSGMPSVAIRIDLPDGNTAIIETSWRLLGVATQAIAARYGWP